MALLVLAAEHGSARRKLVQRLLLVIDLERRQDRVRCNEIDERHEGDLKAKVTWKADRSPEGSRVIDADGPVP